MQILLQPCDGIDGVRNYKESILKNINLYDYKEIISKKDFDELIKIYPSGKAKLWGIRKGKSNYCKDNFHKIHSGDLVLFQMYENISIIISKAIITKTIVNYDLGRRLWNNYNDRDYDTYMHIYFIKDFQEIESRRIQVKEIGKLINIPNLQLKAFKVIDQYHSNLIINKFKLLDNKSQINSKKETNSLKNKFELAKNNFNNDFKNLVELFDKVELDRETISKQRTEQTFLRQFLFDNNSTFRCGICGKKLPTDLLVTSHIKKRCNCTIEEKLDYKNIVMPMCVLGCDSAFEKGYIYVDNNGFIQINRKMKLTKDLIKHFKEIEGTKCSYFNENTKKYFKQHRNSFGIK